MRGHRLPALTLLAVVVVSGCQAPGSSRRITRAEPALVDGEGAGPAIVESVPARPMTIADRHPLFTKPREYYENSGNNRVVKAAAATLIGVPAGLIGEVRQIVRGRPAAARAY